MKALLYLEDAPLLNIDINYKNFVSNHYPIDDIDKDLYLQWYAIKREFIILSEQLILSSHLNKNKEV